MAALTANEQNGKLIQFPVNQNKPIDPSQVKHRRALMKKSAIKPKRCANDAETELAHVEEHSAEAIKDIADIRKVCSYLLDNKKYRDYLLFVMGINFALRIGDLLSLRFCHILNEDYTFKESFLILEKKTEDTRKRKQNRRVYINEAVMDAVELYLYNTPGDIYLDDYIFRSESNNGKDANRPLSKSSVHRILKTIKQDCELPYRISSHTFRKTFGYHQMLMSGNDPRKLILLQKIFGHSSPTITLAYIGITSEEIDDAYKKLNLGGQDYTRLPMEDICSYANGDGGEQDKHCYLGA